MIKNNINDIDNDSLLKFIIKCDEKMIEEEYLFNPGLEVDYNIKQINNIKNNNSFNLFGLYNKDLFKLYKKISELLHEITSVEQIDFDRLNFYISSNIITQKNFDKNFFYDISAEIKPCYYGMYVLNSDNLIFKFNKEEVKLYNGDIFISNSKNVFNINSNNFTSIIFYISPLLYLNNQYFQKWIPII